ncbi:MAG: methyltransferase domain-containing protein [Anaerolineales bacterium]
MLSKLLAHPLTRGLDIDAPETSALRARIIREKAFLHRIYGEWYEMLMSTLPRIPGQVIELGSGGGFLAERLPGVITSEVFFLPFVRLVASGLALPLQSSSLRSILMIDVLHHLPDLPRFFREAGRTVKPGGVLAMIEPWNSPWSSLIYRHLHHETMDTTAQDWTLSGSRPLKDANIALPWIVFKRDKSRFEKEFPEWRLIHVRPFMPLRYLLSGGISLRSLMPGWSFGFWTGVEKLAGPLAAKSGMFAHIVLEHT